VHIDGRGMGALSGAEGNYLLQNVPAGSYTVVAQFLGYATERRTEIVVAAGQRVQVDFTMRAQALALDGLVVTGVTEATTRAMVPFSVGRVSQEALAAPPMDAASALQGRLAGVNIVSSGGPGAGTDILFRTPTSINRDNTPLIVVDDVILSQSSVDLSTLDIESIEVIKGAAAASLYGSRAAAGVLNIRTLRGGSLPADRMQFRVRSEFGSSGIANPIGWAQYHNFRVNDAGDFLDAGGNIVPRGLAATTQYGFQDQRYPGKVYDHIGSLFNPGNYTTHSATIGYNGGNTNWLAVVTRRDEAGVVRENKGYQRNDFRLNLDHRLRDDLRVAISAFHMRSERAQLPSNTFFDFIHQAPDIDLLQPDPDGTKYIFQPDEQGIRVNPLYQIATQENIANRLRTMASVNMRYNPLAWMAVDVNASYDRSDRVNRAFTPKGIKTPNYPSGGPGSVSRSTGSTDGVNASLGMSVTRDMGLLRTRTSVRGLLEREDNSSFSASGQDLAVGGIGELPAVKVPSISSSSNAIRSSGYFLNTDLTYDDRYIFNALVRRDGSSLFGSMERWHTYYRVSGAYRLAQESWWTIDQISELKLRYSRGTAGGRPNFADRFETFSLQTGGGLSLSTLGNQYLKPEKTTEQEIGLDAIAFDRFSLQLNYATQTTRDQLIAVPLPSLYGFSSQWQNAGTIEGHTLEGSLETRLISRPNLKWSITLLGDRSRNEILDYDRPCHSSGLSYRCAGEVLGVMYGNKFLTSHNELGGIHANSRDAFQVNDDGLLVAVGAGNSWRDGVAKDLWGTNVVIDGVSYPWGRPIRLLGDDGTPMTVKIGDSNADLKWGVSQQLQWRAFTLGALLDGQIGGDVYNNTKQRMYQYARHRDADQAGKPEGEKKPAAYYTSGTSGLYNGNVNISWFVEDASFTKLREVSLRYRLDSARIGQLSRIGIDNATLALIGRNLFLWTNYSGYDPEVGGAIGRIDDFHYPTYRTLTASVEIQF
jgi:TonB-linked SusC/RagA family outer membrane protein